MTELKKLKVRFRDHTSKYEYTNREGIVQAYLLDSKDDVVLIILCNDGILRKALMNRCTVIED